MRRAQNVDGWRTADTMQTADARRQTTAAFPVYIGYKGYGTCWQYGHLTFNVIYVRHSDQILQCLMI